MASRIFPFMAIFLVILISLIFPQTLSKSHHHNNAITQWCNKTPHPSQCKFFMSHRAHNFSPLRRSDFRKMQIQAALHRAVEARGHARSLGPTCTENPPLKAAWRDCLKLFDDTIFQLNQTLDRLEPRSTENPPCTGFDAQTWLSSALTNLDTCRSGSAELNVTGFIDPIAEGFNVTELLSNSLAINAGFVDKNEARKYYNESVDEEKGFPGWVSERERRLLAAGSVSAMRVHVVVAKDGSGRFRTVQAAINAAAKRRFKTRFVIYVKRGVYRENIEVGVGNNNIMLVGDGPRFTIITSGRSVKGGYTTYSSATAGIDGLHFMARGITFRNTAGPHMAQAVALRSASDLSVFFRCAFEGYQDTLMVHSQRQFYKECYIYGTIDFIFGNAAVLFQNCMIYVRRPLKGQSNVITAHGRNDPFQNTAISIHNSQIRAAEDLIPVVHTVKTFLGRPWKLYSRAVFMKTYLGPLVSPLGWLEWDKSSFALKTLYFGEYKNFGPGSSTRSRVRWPGFHVITSPSVAARFTAESLIAGRSWLPGSGVPYTLGL